MAVNNRVALIGTAGGLINALGVEGNHMQLAGEPVVEGFQALRVDITGRRYLRHRTRGLLGRRQGIVKPFSVALKVEGIEPAALRHPRQQAVKQVSIAAWLNP